jgi:hypothetical protein
VPGNAFTGRSGGHCAARASGATTKMQDSSYSPISKNPAAGNLFYELENRIPGHSSP